MAITWLPSHLAMARPRVIYDSLRYDANGKLDHAERDGDLIRLGDRWELPGGRVYRVVDRLSREAGIGNAEALVVESDGLLDILEVREHRLKTARVERAASESAATVVDQLLERAAAGDRNATFHVAALHLYGDRLPADKARAEALFLQAAKNWQVPAMMRLARLFGGRDGWTAAREKRARHCWSEAARYGHPEALFGVHAFTEKGSGHWVADANRAAYLREHVDWHLPLGVDWEKDLAKRVAAVRLAPPPADAQSLATQGSALLKARDALGGRRHVPRAIELLEHAASLGHAGARLELSTILATGLLVPRDIAQAWRYLVQSVQAAWPAALALTGEGLRDSPAPLAAADDLSAQGFARLRTAPDEARPWLEQAAVRWHVASSLAFARLLAQGVGGPRDAARAWHFALFAAEAGDADAMHLAATLAGSGEVPGIGGAEAVHWLKRALAKQHMGARHDWARANELALHGLPRSRGWALYWYGVSAHAGYPEGYLRIGHLELEAPPDPERDQRARQAFRKALDKGFAEAQFELDRLGPEPPAPPFDATLAEHGDLRDVFESLKNHAGPGAWAAVFQTQSQRLADARPYFEQMRDRAPTLRAWPEAMACELVDLYCAARLNDLMLASFQHAPASTWPCPPPDLTREQYVDVWQRLGFEAVTPERFHPFWCEIVSVETTPDVALADDAIAGPPGDATIEIVEMLWPAIRLGAMLFSRAGVRVRAPAAVLAPDVAAASILHWAWNRRHRPTTDLSEGWGHNSQWSTDFRRDFDLGDRYAYNVDIGDKSRVDLRQLPPAGRGGRSLDSLSRADRIDFLRHRCLTRHVLETDAGLWPYHDFHEEPHDPPRRVD